MLCDVHMFWILSHFLSDLRNCVFFPSKKALFFHNYQTGHAYYLNTVMCDNIAYSQRSDLILWQIYGEITSALPRCLLPFFSVITLSANPVFSQSLYVCGSRVQLGRLMLFAHMKRQRKGPLRHWQFTYCLFIGLWEL